MNDMMDEKIPEVIILCEDQGCKHNSGGGYYGVCHHPGKDKLPYGGIDRYYQTTCKSREE